MPGSESIPPAAFRRKLIEVALPLEAINAASVREKSIRHGHPSTLHLWWARRPLAACRAVLFASLVDDPATYISDEDLASRERQRLFRLIERLVPWEASQDEDLLNEARLEIARSLERGGAPRLGKQPPSTVVEAYLAKHAPPVLDPFCGGGSIPLEARRLGLEAHGSDINPVAVLITKALIELPPRFAGMGPVNPATRNNALEHGTWTDSQGLADDISYYGDWIRREAEKRIGHFYPRVRVPAEHGGGEANVVAWLWARTVTCPNPACGCQMPLLSTLALCTKTGKEACIEPVVKRGKPPRIEFTVRSGVGDIPAPPKLGRGAKFRCVACSQTADEGHIKAEGMAGRLGRRLVAVVAERKRRRFYLSPTAAQTDVALSAQPTWAPEESLTRDDPRNIWCVQYGALKFADLFTSRQLLALTVFNDLVKGAMNRAAKDAANAQAFPDDPRGFHLGGRGAVAYADVIGSILGLCASKAAAFWTTGARWRAKEGKSAPAFGRQAIPLVWDFAEVNPFGGGGGDFNGIVDGARRVLLGLRGTSPGTATQLDARLPRVEGRPPLTISTDPPYYDNISYADLADFFYIWLRRSFGTRSWPDLFSTILTPKEPELIASPYRHGGDKRKAKEFFEKGLGDAFATMRAVHDARYPLCIFYAFKQAKSQRARKSVADAPGNDFASTGWETMLEGLMASRCTITGTWPVRSELETRMIAKGTNALASSIVLVCRTRSADAPICSRQDLLTQLRLELPNSLLALQSTHIAPVDLAQAAIGPGMAVFSRYAKVLEEDGSAMTVRTALSMINQILDEVLADNDSTYDADTRWAVDWFLSHGFGEGPYGQAETLARAKNTSMRSLADASIVHSKGGKVRLTKREDLNATEEVATIWEVTHRLVTANENGGIRAAATLLQEFGGSPDSIRDLAYRLYRACERNRWAKEAQGYNGLITSWVEIQLTGANAANEALPLDMVPDSSPRPTGTSSRGSTKKRAVGSRRH